MKINRIHWMVVFLSISLSANWDGPMGNPKRISEKAGLFQARPSKRVRMFEGGNTTRWFGQVFGATTRQFQQTQVSINVNKTVSKSSKEETNS
jgi:hypothetical protein